MTASTLAPAARAKRLVTPPPESKAGLDALAFFEHKLAFETDPADVHHDMQAGVADFVVLDARSREAYQACRVPGAMHLHQARIRENTTRHLDRETTIVTYCWGPGCNGSTRAAAKLAALGFKVREMIGGIEYWRREGYAVEGEQAEAAPLYGV